MRGPAITTLRERMLLAASDTTTAQRLAMVDATVLVLTRGDEEDSDGVWLDFGGDGLTVGDPPLGVEPDIRLRMDAELAERFPHFFFSMAMAEGRMTFEGPVKELLAVNPVLRTAVENGQRLIGVRP